MPLPPSMRIPPWIPIAFVLLAVVLYFVYGIR